MTNQRLRVDWPTCHARGLCFELLPEVIELDDWGYPVIGGEITPGSASPQRGRRFEAARGWRCGWCDLAGPGRSLVLSY